MEIIEVGLFEFYDKILFKKNYKVQGVWVVLYVIVCYGVYLEEGVIMMFSYVNFGVWVGSGFMVDIWVIVGFCVQIGWNVYLSGGVGIGGVLEFLQVILIIIEDNCFIGFCSIVVEGVCVEKEVVFGVNVVFIQFICIIDVIGEEFVIYKGWVLV